MRSVEIEHRLDRLRAMVQEAISLTYAEAQRDRIAPDDKAIVAAIVVGALCGVLDLYDDEWSGGPWLDAQRLGDSLAVNLAAALRIQITEHSGAPPGLGLQIELEEERALQQLHERWAREDAEQPRAGE